jgi:general secretion pathway protein A
VNPARIVPSDLPFKFSPHSGSFHLAAPQQEALAALHAGLTGNDPFILLTGDAGTGKTTVARSLLERLDPDRYALGGMFGPYAEGDPLLAHPVQDFAVRPPRHGEGFLTLEGFFARCESRGREAVLVIDEAQALDSIALGQLWHMVAPPADRRTLLQVVLVAAHVPAAVDELARSGQGLPIGARIHLRRLREAETRDFVLDRLRSGGWSGLPAFGPDALRAIHERSAGVLRRASLLCDRILMWLELEGVRDVSAQVVHAVDTQIRGEWSGLKSEETAARTPEPRTAAEADVPHPTPVQADFAAPTPAVAPAAAAPNAAAWHPLLAVARQGRLPTKALVGVLLLGLVLLVGLVMQWVLRAPPLAPASQRTTSGSVVPMAGPSLPQTPGQQSVTAPAAAPARLPATPPPSRLSSRPPPTPTAARRGSLAVPAVPTTRAEAACSGTADALGLCAAAAPPQPKAAAAPTPAVSPISAPPACTPERAALGLCDAP